MNAKTTAAILGLVVLVLGAGLAILFTSDKKAVADCAETTGEVYKVTIQDSKPSTDDVEGKLCDKITFTNADKQPRKIGFGEHDKHVAYDGIAQKDLGQDKSFTITLNKAGTFHWHDHFDDEVEGHFTVGK